MRRRDLTIGRLRAFAAHRRQLAEHYEHNGPVLHADGSTSIRQRSAEDVLRARCYRDDGEAYAQRARERSEGAA